jgi:hypothetical protein
MWIPLASYRIFRTGKRAGLNPVQRSKASKRVSALIVVCTLVAASWFAGVDRNLLTYQATAVATTNDWSINNVPYQWTSDQTVLYPVKTPDDDWSAKTNFSLLDIRTQHIQKLKGLTTALHGLHATHVQIRHATGEMLWTDNERCVVTTASGVYEEDFKRSPGGYFFWMGNQRAIGFIRNYYEGMEILSQIDNRHSGVRKLSFPKVPPGEMPLVHVLHSPVSGHILLVSWMPNPIIYSHEGGIDTTVIYGAQDSPILRALHRENRSAAILAEYRADDGMVSVRSVTVTLPQYARIQDSVLSPDGRRVLWQLRFSRLSPLSQLGRWIPKLRDRRNTFIAFWLSNSDGSDLHEIAHQPIENPPPKSVHAVVLPDGNVFIPTPDDAQRYQPSNARWLPGGDKISFLYQGRLWLLPVKHR